MLRTHFQRTKRNRCRWSAHLTPAFRLLSAGWLITALLSCTDITHHERDTISVLLSLANGTGFSRVVVDSPFVSVMESVSLSVVPASGGQAVTYDARVGRGNKSIPFAVHLDRGTYTFSASVQSKSAIVLFNGMSSVSIDANHFVVNLPVVPRTPVMVVAPDTTTTIQDDGKSVVAQATIHNPGLDSLLWQLSSRPAVMATCPATCAAFPDSGRIGAGGSQVLTFVIPNTFPAQVLCFTLSSAQGDVPVCWRKD
jgi:hypothetical protein